MGKARGLAAAAVATGLSAARFGRGQCVYAFCSAERNEFGDETNDSVTTEIIGIVDLVTVNISAA